MLFIGAMVPVVFSALAIMLLEKLYGNVYEAEDNLKKFQVLWKEKENLNTTNV